MREDCCGPSAPRSSRRRLLTSTVACLREFARNSRNLVLSYLCRTEYFRGIFTLKHRHRHAHLILLLPPRPQYLNRSPSLPSPAAAPPAQAFDEVVLTTEWEADGFLAACMVFAIVTAEARRAPVAPGGTER